MKSGFLRKQWTNSAGLASLDWMIRNESTESAPIEELTGRVEKLAREKESLRRRLEKANSEIERLRLERIAGLLRWAAAMVLDGRLAADRPIPGLPSLFETAA